MKRNKYRAKRTIAPDGTKFPSKREARRYAALKLLEKAGQITHLELQKPFPVFINGIKVFVWRSDFVYFENGKRIIEDCKGFRTPLYRIKKKCVEAYYDVKILET